MATHVSSAVLNREHLKQYFLDGCKDETDLRVGVEWEKIGVYRENAKGIRYSGPNGVEAIFKALMKKFEWQGVFSGLHVIALKKNGSSITLEPGGQIELSGRKAAFLSENARELHNHLRELKEVSEPLGIAWLGVGLQPVSAVETIEWVPKERYAIMRERLKTRGALTYCMMKQTASIQIALDYTSENDAVEKLRLAMGLSPVLSAIFANSPISAGEWNGFYSKRAYIWSQTDPERTGIIYNVFDPAFSFDDYLEYALKVPMLFILREEKWLPVDGLRFGEFLENGFGGYTATEHDWELHLTTIFTEARLKKYVEIRSADCQNRDLGMSVPALLKGLFYDASSRKQAWRFVSELSLEERLRLAHEAPLKGLKTRLGSADLWEIGCELIKLGEEGLEGDESKYLAPLKEIFNKRMTPADLLIGCAVKNASPQERINQILRCAAI